MKMLRKEEKKFRGKETLLSRTVGVCGNHVSSSLSDSPAVLAGSMKPGISSHRVSVCIFKVTE